jgi:outer membrane protein TolC
VLRRLVAAALDHNPRLAAAVQRIRQAEAEMEGTAGFLDPRLAAQAGHSQDGRGLPGVLRDGALPSDATVAEAGLEFPLKPGAYFGVGAAERRLSDLSGDPDHVLRTLAGMQLRVPLWRDRGFAGWRADRGRAQAEVEAAHGAWLAEAQELRLDVEQAFIAWQQALAQIRISRAATVRAEKLLEEAETLVELEVVAAHQLFPARFEVALRREEETAAQQRAASGFRRLAALVGSEAVAKERGVEVELLAWAKGVALPIAEPLGDVLRRRGDYRELRERWAAEAYRLERARDALRSELNLRVAYTWEQQDPARSGDEEAEAEDHGMELVLLWRKVLGTRTEKQQVAAVLARRQEQADLLRRLAWDTEAELDVARREYEAAVERLELTNRAVEDAGQAASAEAERFRLGEGTSRQVLDAQKDLTAVVRRQNSIAAELLRAYASYRYVSGQPLEGTRPGESEQAP